MTTSKEVNTAELSAGMAAAKQIIAARVPRWQQHLIPEEAIEAAVVAVVTAVDDVRDRAAASQPKGNAT